MSGQPNRNPTDPAKFRQQYMANLALEANINDKNLQANKIYKKTGQVAEMTDNRTTAEKLADVERLKIDVRSELSEIADGEQANAIVQEIHPLELEFLAQHIKEIVADIKPKYKYGVTAAIFIPYLDAYMRRANETNEVNYGLQQAAGADILLNIQQILGTMINRQQLDALSQQVQAAHHQGFINTNILTQLQRDTAQLQHIIPDQGFFTHLATQQDIVTKQMVQQELNQALQNMPTNQQLIDLQRQLNVAITSGDRARANQIANALHQILAVNPVLVEQMQQIRREVLGQIVDLRNDITGLTEDLKADIIQELQYLGLTNEKLIKEVITKMQNALKQSTEDEIARVGADLIARLNEIRDRGDTLTQKVVKECVKDSIAETLAEQAESSSSPAPNPFRLLSPSLSPSEHEAQYQRDIRNFRQPRRPPQRVSPFSDIMNEQTFGLPPAALSSSPAEASKPKHSLSKIPRPTGGGGGGKSTVKGGHGSGLHRMSGRGLSKKPNVVLQTDFSQGIMPTQKYVPFGRYFIDHHRINDDVISLRRGNGVNIVGLPVRRVSKDLGEVVRTIIKQDHPSYNQINKLTKEEKDYLHKLAKSSNLLHRLHIPSPTKEEDDQDINQFEILKGELLCGNDGNETIKRFKVLVMRMMNKGLLPKGQAKDILIELATLGY